MEKGSGYFFINSSSCYFFNKTDFEQYLFNNPFLVSAPYFMFSYLHQFVSCFACIAEQ